MYTDNASASTRSLRDDDPSRRLSMVRTHLTLLLMNVRYWTTIAPVVHAQLRRWERHARTIPDETLRTLALAKLREEVFNTQVAATLATTIPRRRREPLVRAIAALQVMYDYLDGLTELAHQNHLQTSKQLYQAFTDAVNLEADTVDYYRLSSYGEDNGYLRALSEAVRAELRTLPGAAAGVLAVAHTSAIRCATSQSHVHAAPTLGQSQLEQWALHESHGTGLDWREFLAGAVASVIAVHALIAAAADERSTPQTAAALDRAYLAISAISTMLDSYVDHELDASTESAWYLRYFDDDHEQVTDHLIRVARCAIARLHGLPNEAHHVMTLGGVFAYYGSAPTASANVARSVFARTHNELRPIVAPALLVMRTWRKAKRLRKAVRRISPAVSP